MENNDAVGKSDVPGTVSKKLLGKSRFDKSADIPGRRRQKAAVPKRSTPRVKFSATNRTALSLCTRDSYLGQDASEGPKAPKVPPSANVAHVSIELVGELVVLHFDQLGLQEVGVDVAGLDVVGDDEGVVDQRGLVLVQGQAVSGSWDLVRWFHQVRVFLALVLQEFGLLGIKVF